MEKSNAEIAAFLGRVGDLLELKGENPFKVRSYRTASSTIGALAEPAAGLARSGGAAALQKLPGIGKSISLQVAEFAETGTSDAFERLRAEIPETVAEILFVRGIGMKMATTLYRDFGVLGLDDLRRFAEGGGFEAVPGLGDRTIARLVPAVATAWKGLPHLPLAEAARLAERLRAGLEARVPGAEVTVAGEVRRGVADVSAVELLAVTAAEKRAAAEAFAGLPEARETRVLTPDRAEVATDSGLPAILHVAAPGERWVALVRATGPRRHLRDLEEAASAAGLELGAGGLYEAGAGAPVELGGEEELYARLGLEPVPPSLRE